ncbi:MAG: DUF202 domain-containing protein [Dehalococcoidia bacterium]|nr:DUF202 domain-containing protein [Dehalococcoidia bacterium]
MANVQTPEPARSEVDIDDAMIRTHLANERTFLAWLRTAIVLIGAGVAAAALTEVEGSDRLFAIVLGTLSVLVGCGLVAFAYIDYRETLVGIERGTFRPATRLPLLATLLIAIVGVGALVFAVVEWSND